MKRQLFKILFISLILVLGFSSLRLETEAATLSVGFGASRISKEVTSFKDMRTSHVVTQSLDYSCGPAALATLLSYYFEDKVTEKEIINFLLLTGNLAKIKENKGFSLLDLKNFARYKGYAVVGYKMDLEFLAKLNKPVLVPINIKEYSHFVIFRGSKGNRVFLADPALGKMTMLVDRFLKIWQGGIGLVLAKRGEENLHSPLKLSNEEEAVVAGGSQARNLLSIDLLGNVYRRGEF